MNASNQPHLAAGMAAGTKLAETVAGFLPKSPATVAAVSFTAGIGVGAIMVHVLTSRSTPNPLLGRLGQQAMDGLQAVVPDQIAAFLRSQRAAG